MNPVTRALTILHILTIIMGASAYPSKLVPRLTFTVTQGKSRRTYETTDFHRCIKLDNEQIPSVVHLNSNKAVCRGSAYQLQLVTYSSDTCNDGHGVNQFPVEATSPIVLNERTPICSFKLGQLPWLSTRVAFVFEGTGTGGPVYESFNVADTECLDLCSHSGDRYGISAKYPLSMNILELDGRTANNFVELFSKNGCVGNSRISYHNDGSYEYEIPSGVNLASLTMKQRHSVGSFLILCKQN